MCEWNWAFVKMFFISGLPRRALRTGENGFPEDQAGLFFCLVLVPITVHIAPGVFIEPK